MLLRLIILVQGTVNHASAAKIRDGGATEVNGVARRVFTLPFDLMGNEHEESFVPPLIPPASLLLRLQDS